MHLVNIRLLATLSLLLGLLNWPARPADATGLAPQIVPHLSAKPRVVVPKSHARAVSTRPTPAQMAEFHEQLLKVMPPPPLPAAARCFSGTYPKLPLTEETCGPPPTDPFPISRSGAPQPRIVGAGIDNFAVIQGSNRVIAATGSLGNVDVKGEYGFRNGNTRTSYPDTYALELNTNRFSSPACGGSPGCLASVQFIYSTSHCKSGEGCIFMAYWLLEHPQPCPSGFHFYAGTIFSSAGCWLNTGSERVPLQSWTDLRGFSLQGFANSAEEGMFVTTAAGKAVSITNQGLATLYQGWTGVEFNLVGDCCGTQAVFFNGTSTLQIRADLLGGSKPAAFTCTGDFTGKTAESNNMNLTGSCTNTGTGISFVEQGGIPVSTPPPPIPCDQLKKNIDALQQRILQETAHPPACPSGIAGQCTQQLRTDEAALAAMRADDAKRCGD